jgi:hypothetical protein
MTHVWFAIVGIVVVVGVVAIVTFLLRAAFHGIRNR